MADNQRYRDIGRSIMPDAHHAATVNEIVDAVAAAVRADEGQWRRQAIRHAKALVRRDIARAIRAQISRDWERGESAFQRHMEAAARIAEGNTGRG